jgi:small subunit ribosomal protein S1
MSWTQRIKHPSEMFQKGDEVEAAVINIDTTDGEKPKISLGIKQLNPDPWSIIPDKFKVGKHRSRQGPEGARLRSFRRA